MIAHSATTAPSRHSGSSKNGTDSAMTIEHVVAPSGRRGADTLERRIAPGAFFNSGTKYNPPKCHPITRTAIFDMIMNSVGKSSIARTLSLLSADEGLLAASFFSRSVAGLNTEKHLVATLAHQISLSIPKARRYIAQAVESDPSTFSGSLETRLQTLIVKPLLQAWSEDVRDSDDDQPRNVHMFPNAQNLLIQDTAINNAGRDITIIHNNVTHNYHDTEPSPPNLLSQWSNLFSNARSHIFHAAEVIKSILPSGFSTSPAIDLEEKVAEDAHKYPPLNAKILLSKTSMCIPGFVSQTLSSVRYSFF